MPEAIILAGILCTAIGLYKEDVHKPSRVWMYMSLAGFVIVCAGLILGLVQGGF